MSRFRRFEFTAHPDANATMALKRSFGPLMIQPHSTYLRDHLWVFVRVVAVVALIGLLAFMVHLS
jgi:hypothetical protein